MTPLSSIGLVSHGGGLHAITAEGLLLLLPSLVILAWVHGRPGKDTWGRTHYHQAIQNAMKVEPFYRLKLAHALGETGQDDEAAAVLQEGLIVEPLHPEMQLEMAKLWQRRGDQATAQDHLGIALAAWTEADPDYEPAIQARALADQLTIQ